MLRKLPALLLATFAVPIGIADAKVIDGYGPVKLGMSLESTLAALPEVSWSELLLRSCHRDLPLQGCLLVQEGDGYFTRIDGIPFKISVSINKHNVVTDITLRYERERADMTERDCLSLFDRTVDQVVKEYGPLAGRTNHERGSVDTPHRTSGGTSYIQSSTKRGFFLAGPLRSNIQGVKLPAAAPITKWNGEAYADTFVWFLTLGRKHSCSIDINMNAPASVERTHPDAKVLD